MADTRQSKDNKKISRQEKRIAALKKLLIYHREITETIREPFIILDKDLFVVTANLAFYRKFKVKKKDTEGRRIYELGNNQWDAAELRELLEHILPKHRVMNNYEVTHDFPNLGPRTILLNARQIDSKQLILLAMEDITERNGLTVATEEVTANLIMQRDQLQGLNDAKDEFIMLASHQLRTPATVVKQYVEMLTHEYVGAISTDQMTMLKIIGKGNDRQLDIIEDLLRVAKVDAGKVYLEKSSCDVVQQVEIVMLEQAILFKSRRQSIVLKKPTYKVMAFIDPKLMLMVLENLIDNAGKYSQVGGKITITITQNTKNTIISIKDNGVGIREEDRNKLFKKFSRIDNPMSNTVGGTGLGLYWAKKILDLHKGSIEVASVLHKGSTFTIKTPIDTTYPSKLIPAGLI